MKGYNRGVGVTGMRRLGAALAAATSFFIAVAAANATTFYWTAVKSDGETPFISGTLVATGNGLGQYTVTSMTGTPTGGCPTADPCGISALLAPGTFASNDNLLFYPGTPFLDASGISFALFHYSPDDSIYGNFSYSGGSYNLTTLTLSNPFDGPRPFVSFEVLSTPLPASLPLFATGLGALGLLGWRRKRKGAALAVA